MVAFELVSVVMPVYNAMPHLDESIGSITGQTHANFEFVIRDDGSTDGSREVLRTWAARDDRVRLFEGTERLGPVGNSNWVAQHATAPLLARMDADDVCDPDRLRRQVEVFGANPDLDLVGTLWEGIDARGHVVRPPDRWRLLRRSPFAPFAHGSMMVRTEAFRRIGGYRDQCLYWEDLDLYLRLARLGRLAVVAEPLYGYRHTQTNARLDGRRRDVEAAVDLMYRCIGTYEKGGSYEPLLCSLETAAAPDVSARTIVSVASLQLWAGIRPTVLRRVWRGAVVSRRIEGFAMLVWAGWARTAPASLRRALRAFVRARNAAVAGRIHQGQVYEWAPGQGSRLIGARLETGRRATVGSAPGIGPDGPA
jgi:hypothetical protein